MLEHKFFVGVNFYEIYIIHSKNLWMSYECATKTEKKSLLEVVRKAIKLFRWARDFVDDMSGFNCDVLSLRAISKEKRILVCTNYAKLIFSVTCGDVINLADYLSCHDIQKNLIFLMVQLDLFKCLWCMAESNLDSQN